MDLWQFDVIEGYYEQDEASSVRVYGVAVRRDGRTWWQMTDVDTDREAVATLTTRLQAAQPEPCHWEELVADFIACRVTD